MQKVKKRKTGHLHLAMLLVLAAAAAALVLDSAERLVVTQYEAASALVPESFDGFRIVQLSDLHGKAFGAGSSRLLEAVESLKPDMIAITGDMCDEKTDPEVIDALLKKLTLAAPVYYVSGNHEWASGAMDYLPELFEKHGVIYLQNEYELLERGGDSIVIAGAEDPNSFAGIKHPDELMEEATEKYPGKFRLLLNHRNDLLEKYPGIEADLALCGHAHGGVIRLPLLGGVLGGGFTLFPDYTSGRFTGEKCEMIVSRGLGNSVFVPRVFNNPEIVSVTLRAE